MERTDFPASGTLYVVATPIGNLADISRRGLDVLGSVHRIVAEDTRRTRKLLSHYDIHKPLMSYHNHNMVQRGHQLIGMLRAGEDLALVTDAGTPGISDPGALLIHQALEEELPVEVIPGPTALIMALVASGLSTHPFVFLGFPPARGSGRKHFFTSYALLPMTLILYESPKRLVRTLEDILSYWGNRRIAVARELTKKHEEIFRGTVLEAQQHYTAEVLGEITLVVEGSVKREEPEEDKNIAWREELCDLLRETGLSVKDATKEIVQRYSLSRQEVYREAVKIKEKET